MFCHRNLVTRKKSNPGRIIVLSPQLGDIGKLNKKKNYLNRGKVDRRNPVRQSTCKVSRLKMGNILRRSLSCKRRL